jgi:alpha-tubulin suppressor-like RCC1 family protein
VDQTAYVLLSSFQDGQLGLGDSTARSSPQLIVSLTSIVQVSAGAYHTLFLTSDHQVYSVGRNTVFEECSLIFRLVNWVWVIILRD